MVDERELFVIESLNSWLLIHVNQAISSSSIWIEIVDPKKIVIIKLCMSGGPEYKLELDSCDVIWRGRI